MSLDPTGTTAARPAPVTAEHWYETVPFADGVTLIHEPWMPSFFRCNMWHIRGRDRDLLIDAGLGAVPLRRHVPLLNGRPLICLLSHSHFDHIGCAHEFADRWAHAAEAGIMAAPTNRDSLAAGYLVPTATGGCVLFDRPPAGWPGEGYRIAPAPPTRLLDDGAVIDLGDRQLTVLHTPGHSPGHLALWEERSGTLFAQDAVYDGPLVDDCPHSDIPAYVATLQRLRGLDPAVVHGGHFASFGRTRFRQLIDSYRAARA